MNKIPTRFSAVTADKAMLCLHALGEMVIHFEMEFDKPLDVDRLARALDLLLDAEPILGCRFEMTTLKVYWERLPREERQNFIQASSRTEYDAFLAEPHQPERGPQLRACLWRDGKKDRLLLKIAHEVADAGGCKEAAARLGKIYTQLAVDPGYLPQPNLRRRGVWQVLHHIPRYYFPCIYFNFLKKNWVLARSTNGFGLPITGAFSGRPLYRLQHLPAERVAQLAEYGRQRNATLNDLMLAAYLRGIARTGGWDGAARLQAMISIDLRRHHIPGGKAEALSNLSIFEAIFIENDGSVDFAGTLDAISREIGRRKANWIGLSDYIGMVPTLWLLPARWSAAILSRLFVSIRRRTGIYNSLTNMGPILPEHVTFDQPASAAWLIVPPVFPPTIVIGLSGYAGSLTLSVASYGPAATPELLDDLFDNMLAQLPV